MKGLLGVSIALCSASACSRARLAASWGLQVRSAGLNFTRAIAACRPCPRSSSAAPAAVQGESTTARRRLGCPKATQAIIPTKRKNGLCVQHSRLDSNSCFGCHNDPVVGRRCRQCVRLELRERAIDSIDPSFSSERHTIACRRASSSFWRAR